MRKLLTLCTLLLTTVLILTACSSEKTKVYTEKNGKQEHVTTIYYNGETVNKVVTNSTLTTDKANLDSTLDGIKSTISQKPNFDGYTRSAEIKDGKVVITTEIDYNKLDFEKYKGRVHLSGSDTLENERKLETVEYHLKDAGATEKK
ncbi:DUF1307 domain-containing protein [Gemella sanguinis]